MAFNTKLTNYSASVEADAFAVLFNDGYLDIYDGIQPETGDSPITDQILLAELRFGNPAFSGAVNGVITAIEITAANAVATGIAKWFRCFKSDGSTALLDGSAGTSLCNLILNTVNIEMGAEVSINSFQHTVTK